MEAMGRAPEAVSASDALGFFEHRGTMRRTNYRDRRSKLASGADIGNSSHSGTHKG